MDGIAYTHVWSGVYGLQLHTRKEWDILDLLTRIRKYDCYGLADVVRAAMYDAVVCFETSPG